MPTAHVNDTELFYTEAGSGPPCLVMHGGLGFDHSYMRTLEPLEDVMRMIYYDHRGNGRSGRTPVDTITIPQLAADADGLREHLGLETVGVLGHSYGGFVALEYATHHPERVSHVIALSTSPGAFEPTKDELAQRADPSWITPEVQHALDLFGQPPPATDDEFRTRLPELAVGYLRSTPVDALRPILEAAILDVQSMVQGFVALAGWSVEQQLDRIECPTLVLCGRYDLFTTPECSARIASRVPNAELAWLEHSGHFPWFEEPDAFFSAVKEWAARRLGT